MEVPKSEVKIEKIDVKDLPKGFERNANYIKCVECGDITEFVLLANKPKPIPITRITKDLYADENGEIHEFNHSENKSTLGDSVRKTLSHLRAIINTNCSDDKKLKWITFTYAENMTDTKQLYKDFDKFWKRFKYYSEKNNLPIPEYISVAEPQGRGAWHLHIIFIYPCKAPFIDNNSVLYPMWSHGYTKVKAVHGVDNLGAYFSAYLADIPLDEYERDADDTAMYEIKSAIVDDDGHETEKKFVKGARLKFYPVGMNIYRTSRGIKQPTINQIDKKEYATKKASAGTLTFSSACSVLSASVSSSGSSGNGDKDEVLFQAVNYVYHAYYNRKRRQNQGGAGGNSSP